MGAFGTSCRAMVFFVVLLFGTAPSAAANSAAHDAPHATLRAAPVVVASNGISWHGFVRYWKGFVNRSDRVVLVVALVGAAALFIITRGRWLR